VQSDARLLEKLVGLMPRVVTRNVVYITSPNDVDDDNTRSSASRKIHRLHYSRAEVSFDVECN
jgi:hypothetical protein